MMDELRGQFKGSYLEFDGSKVHVFSRGRLDGIVAKLRAEEQHVDAEFMFGPDVDVETNSSEMKLLEEVLTNPSVQIMMAALGGVVSNVKSVRRGRRKR